MNVEGKIYILKAEQVDMPRPPKKYKNKRGTENEQNKLQRKNPKTIRQR